MEINEALDAIQTLVHCQGISREIEALETIRATLAVVQNSSHNSAMDAIRKAYIEGYSMGHHHTVEGAYWPEQAADDWLSEQHQ